MKKLSFVFSALVILGILITGCGQAPATVAPTNPPAAATSKPPVAAATNPPAAAPTNPPAAAPTNPPAAARKTSKDILKLANINDVGTLDPFQSPTLQASRVFYQVYETLFMTKKGGGYEPFLATSWQWIDDKHLQVNLRQGVKFHNGDPLTAADVVASLKFALANPLQGPNFVDFDGPNTKAVDDKTVVFAFANPNAIAMDNIAFYLLILPKSIIDKNPDSFKSNPVGTGPYKFVKWVTGDSVTLERFDDYWGEKAIIKTVVFRSIPEPTQRGIELQTGGVDFAFDVGATVAKTVQGDKNLTLYRGPSTLVNNIFFNSTPGRPFANESLRKAVASAVSAPDIIKGAYDGVGTVPFSIVSSDATGYDKSLTADPWPQDLTKAKAFFKESGVAEGTTVKMIIDDRAARIATAEIMKNELAQIGLNVTIQQYDFGTAMNNAMDLKGDWDIFLLGTNFPSAAGYASRLITSPFTAYCYTPAGAELKAMITQMLVTVDAAKSQDQMAKIQGYVNAHVVEYAVQQDEVLDGYSAQLQGIDTAIRNNMVFLAKDLYFK